MTGGPGDRLTAARQLTAILSISVRPRGKVEGTIRDDGHLYRFSGLTGLTGLPVAVERWLDEVFGPCAVSDLEAGPSDDDSDRPPAGTDEEKPCR